MNKREDNVQVASTPKAVEAHTASIRLLLEVDSGHVLLLVCPLAEPGSTPLALERPTGPLVHIADVRLQLTSVRIALATLLAGVRSGSRLFTRTNTSPNQPEMSTSARKAHIAAHCCCE